MEHYALITVIDLLISSGLTESAAISLVGTLIEQEAPVILECMLEEEPNDHLLN